MKDIDWMLISEAQAADVPKRHSFYTRYGKRGLDLLLSLLLLPLIFPVIALIWMLTRLDGGPGFYGQMRVGKDGRIFTCWKVRSMIMDAEKVLREICEKDPAIAAEWHTYQKLENDPRITKIGRFIRATSLDELPQIWNVLRGDMSFVGPRPFMTSQEHLYRQDGGTAYFHMRPGITGLWQVEGRGATSFAARIGYDTKYFQDMSFVSDLAIMSKTIKVIFNGAGT